jgi:hypothetical protein
MRAVAIEQVLRADIARRKMQELIANSKETLKTSRDVSFSEIADFSFARRAVSELKKGR